jgi:hypothetical protein
VSIRLSGQEAEKGEKLKLAGAAAVSPESLSSFVAWSGRGIFHPCGFISFVWKYRFFSADITLRLGNLPSEQERNDDKPQSKDKQAGGFRQCSDLAHLQS